jgi:hypothetical protein
MHFRLLGNKIEIATLPAPVTISSKQPKISQLK